MSTASSPPFADRMADVHRQTDRLFFWLLLLQWVAGVALGLAARVEPGRLLLLGAGGALVNVFPLVLIGLRPGHVETRLAVTLAQTAWSGLLVVGTHGRFGTEYHAFGSLAFLSFYQSPSLLFGALGLASAGGVLLPAGIASVGWLVFEGVVLVDSTLRSRRSLASIAERELWLARLRESVERQIEEKTAELAKSRERYRALVEGSHAVPWEFDPHVFRFVYLSPQAYPLLGFDLDALNGRLSTLVHPADRRVVRDLVVTLSRDDGPGQLDFDCRIANARGEWVEVRSRVSRSPGGNSLIGISFDVTQQKKLELELRQSQKLESVGRLAAGIAHEINTPIQFVGDSVHFLRDAWTALADLVSRYRGTVRALAPPHAVVRDLEEAEAAADVDYLLEQAPRAVERTLDGVGRVASIVRAMKDFAHPDRSEMVPTDLNRAIEATLTIARNEYKYVADLVLDLGTLPAVTCHAGDVNQVVLNLVVNAAQAIAEKVGSSSERGRIGVRTAVDGTDVLIEISDSGGGIPEAIQDRIFEPFFTTKPVGQGTGQGLAISRAVVVEKHGGMLSFTSAPGLGTTFVVRLPIAPRTRATRFTPQVQAA